MVLDRSGRYVPDLKRTEFEIFENGDKQDVSYFESISEPLTVLLLLDTSGSMDSLMKDVGRGAAAFITQLRDHDRVSVATFSDKTKINLIIQATLKKDLKGAFHLNADIGDSYTATFDAVESALKYLDQFKGRKALVLFSDGELYGKHETAASNLRRAQEGESLIYTVRLGEYPMYQPGYVRVITRENISRYGNTLALPKNDLQKLIGRVNAYMYGLASASGGRGFQINQIADLPATFRAIAAELSQIYRLGYSTITPPIEGELRKLTVKVNVPNVAVRSRNEVVYKAKELK